jgi:outer membrane protein OmpA-like peptidoglycan-associated protein
MTTPTPTTTKTTLKLTTLGKFTIALILIALIATIYYFITPESRIIPSLPGSKEVINLSLDEWIGWRSILMANGGLETKKGSIYDKLGLTLHIKNINDNDAKLSALMAGSLNAMGSTINRYAFEFDKLQRARIPVKMIVVTNTSDGGDGIIARRGINSIEDLAGKRVALARFTEAQCLLEWCLMNSSLNSSQIEGIRQNIIFTDDAGKAGEAFFAGKADAAATWQPFLTQAEGSTDGHILVSTKTINNFILDGIIFREDFMKANPGAIDKFVRGVLQATDALLAQPPQDPYTNYSYLVDSFPMCANLPKTDIEGMFPDAHLSDFSDNRKYLGQAGGLAEQVFAQSSSIWKMVGESANPAYASMAFSGAVVDNQSRYFQFIERPGVKISMQDREATQKTSPIFTKRLTINFRTAESTILEDSYAVLSTFAQTAKMAERSIVQIEGNTDDVGDDHSNQLLSEKRARAVATYLQYQGIDPTRLIIIGNGENRPIASNYTGEGRAQNRRTDIMIKEIKITQ